MGRLGRLTSILSFCTLLTSATAMSYLAHIHECEGSEVDEPTSASITTTVEFEEPLSVSDPNNYSVEDVPAVRKYREGYHNQEFTLQEVIDDLTRTDPESVNQQKRIVVEKEIRVLSLYLGDHLLKEYGVSLSVKPEGDKEVRGDLKTPEGEFYVALKNPNSSYHLSLLISYPNIEDAERGLESGLINQYQHDRIVNKINSCEVPPQGTILGNSLTIHGGGGGPDEFDWTWGCVAVDNNEMDEIYAFSESSCHEVNGKLVPKTTITILP